MTVMRTAAVLILPIVCLLARPAELYARPDAVASPPAPSSVMHVFGMAPAPFGHVLFCERQPAECVREHGSIARVTASADRMRELRAVNGEVNRTIEPVTDLVLYGRREHWTMPVSQGDCEDYVIMKRRKLIERGWPAGSLLVTVVQKENGDGHAVLTVRTTRGDFILDNLDNSVRLWHKTPYRFLMRQSFLDPRKWMLLQPLVTPAPPVSAAHSGRDWSTRILLNSSER